MESAKEFVVLPLETRRRRLKRLVYKTVPDGEVKETAAAAGIEDYTLYKMRDENRENYNLVDPRLVSIMLHRHDLRLLDFIENLFDRIAFPRPQSLTSITELNRQVTAVLQECTHVVQEVIRSVAPESPGAGTITAAELTSVEKEINEAQAALEALRHAARELHETGKGKI